MSPWWWNGAKSNWWLVCSSVKHSSVESGLLMRSSKMHGLDLLPVFAWVVFAEVNVQQAFIVLQNLPKLSIGPVLPLDIKDVLPKPGETILKLNDQFSLCYCDLPLHDYHGALLFIFWIFSMVHCVRGPSTFPGISELDEWWGSNHYIHHKHIASISGHTYLSWPCPQGFWWTKAQDCEENLPWTVNSHGFCSDKFHNQCHWA